MSENTNPTAEELVRNVTFSLQRSAVIPTPVDPTLSHEGEAADAKATGDAIALAVDGMTVNGKTATNKAFTVYAGDILMSNAQGASTIAEAMGDIGDKDASQIMYDTENLVSVKTALDGIISDLDSELSSDEIDEIFDEVFGGEE